MGYTRLDILAGVTPSASQSTVFPQNTVYFDKLYVKLENNIGGPYGSHNKEWFTWGAFDNSAHTAGWSCNIDDSHNGNHNTRATFNHDDTSVPIESIRDIATRTLTIDGSEYAEITFSEPLKVLEFQSNGQPSYYLVQTTFFEPSKSIFQFSSTGGSESFTIEAHTGWTATTASDWVSLSQTTGTTGGTLVLTCIPNASDNARTATITFTDANGETFNITVNQKKRGMWIPKAKVRKGALIVSKEYWEPNQ